jgi:hypothetical protein
LRQASRNMRNGGKLEIAQQMANHASVRTRSRKAVGEEGFG